MLKIEALNKKVQLLKESVDNKIDLLNKNIEESMEALSKIGKEEADSKNIKENISNNLDKIEKCIKENSQSKELMSEIRENLTEIKTNTKDKSVLKRIDVMIKQTDIKEAAPAKTNVKTDDFDLLENIKLKESVLGEDATIEVVLIEAGTNELSKRHYPVQTIEEAAPSFQGLKMYLNHPTKTEERERPERNLEHWVSTIMEAYAVDGKAMAKVYVHDRWLRERLKDKIFCENVGLSINAGGKIRYGKVKGTTMQIVEKILPRNSKGIASVDWVTEAGARGRIPQLIESRRREMDFENMTIEQLKEARPDLIESIVKSKQSDEVTAKLKADLKEANEKIEASGVVAKKAAQAVSIDAILKEATKLPELTKVRIKESITTVYEKESDLKEAITGLIKKELEYISKLSDKGQIKLKEASTDEKTLKESVTKDLENRLGIKEEKKEDE